MSQDLYRACQAELEEMEAYEIGHRCPNHDFSDAIEFLPTADVVHVHMLWRIGCPKCGEHWYLRGHAGKLEASSSCCPNCKRSASATDVDCSMAIVTLMCPECKERWLSLVSKRWIRQQVTNVRQIKLA